MKYLRAVEYLAEQNILKPDADWEIKENKKGRSRNANAYFWELVNKIAKACHTTDTDIHDKILVRNIAYYYNEEGGIDWKVSPLEPNNHGLIVEQIREDYVYYLCSKMRVTLTKENGRPATNKKSKEPITGWVYWHIKGTHQMDTGEMSRILDDTIFEAKQLGIEVRTPDEIARLEATWNAR